MSTFDIVKFCLIAPLMLAIIFVNAYKLYRTIKTRKLP